jgi:ATP-dependent 26S proteasome regulatory subunit
MQCKERVELLEALKASRQEKPPGDSTNDESNGKLSKTSSRTQTQSSEDNGGGERGFIGNGTIPAISYPDLSRPGPPLPQRPPMMTKNSSDRAVVGRVTSNERTYAPSSSRTATSSSSATLASPMKKTSRSPSPEKGRTMLHTLRSGDRSGRKPVPRPPRPSGGRRENPVTNKAASMAWQSMGRGGRARLGRSLDVEHDSSNVTLSDGTRKNSASDPTRPTSSGHVRYDSKTRTLVPDDHPYGKAPSPTDLLTGKDELFGATGRSNSYPFPPTDPGQPGAVQGSMLTASALQDLIDLEPMTADITESSTPRPKRTPPPPPSHSRQSGKLEPLSYPTYLKEYPETSAKKSKADAELPLRRKPAVKDGVDSDVAGSSSKVSRRPVAANMSSPRRDRHLEKDEARRAQRREARRPKDEDTSSQSVDDDTNSSEGHAAKTKRKQKLKEKEEPILADPTTPTSDDSEVSAEDAVRSAWEAKVAALMKNLPKGVDEGAAKQIFNEIVVQGDEVHWDDVAGLDIAKKALKEAVVYPFLRPDLFMGLREPARGMLLFGPPGTGKTMLARAVATESRSTFFSISASSLTSKFLGESEKLVRALFSLAKSLAPSIIFVDEIDSLLSARSGSGEHEATRRIKTEFLIQWSDLQRAAAGREQSEKEKERGDASRVLVLAATNLPWAIDEAARRRFVRRQYIPLPEDETRAVQLRTLLGHQKHGLDEEDIQRLVDLTDGMCSSFCF